jgi:hypothetical protein
MLPILISLSVAPVSYFFCASAEVLISAAARLATAMLRVFKRMVQVSLWQGERQTSGIASG